MTVGYVLRGPNQAMVRAGSWLLRRAALTGITPKFTIYSRGTT